MVGIVQRRLRTLREWEEVWSTPAQVPLFVQDLGLPGSIEPEATFHGAVHFMAGFLQRFDFRLYRNGILPVIERRAVPLNQEILVRLGPNPVRGAYVPISLHLQVSHDGLREVRERYRPTAGRSSAMLVSGNFGQVQLVPTFDIWNVATEGALIEITDSLQDDLLPYLEMLSSPNQLRRAIFDGEAPMFDPETSVEWLLMEFGRSDARDYIRQMMDAEALVVQDFWSKHDRLKGQERLGYLPGDFAHNLAVIAYSHNICSRWLY